MKTEFTLRQLYSHAAGIRHYLPKDTSATRFHNNIQTGLKIAKDDTLLYLPGYKFSYSSYGYNIAGAYITSRCNRKVPRNMPLLIQFTVEQH